MVRETVLRFNTAVRQSIPEEKIQVFLKLLKTSTKSLNVMKPMPLQKNVANPT